MLGMTPAPGRPVPKLPTQSEKEFMQGVIELAHLLGWRHFHDNATNGPRHCWHCGRKSTQPRNIEGWPDLVLIRRPRVIWAELKREGEEPTDAQLGWLEELRACGQEVYIWRPSDHPAILKILQG